MHRLIMGEQRLIEMLVTRRRDEDFVVYSATWETEVESGDCEIDQEQKTVGILIDTTKYEQHKEHVIEFTVMLEGLDKKIKGRSKFYIV